MRLNPSRNSFRHSTNRKIFTNFIQYFCMDWFFHRNPIRMIQYFFCYQNISCCDEILQKRHWIHIEHRDTPNGNPHFFYSKLQERSCCYNVKIWHHLIEITQGYNCTRRFLDFIKEKKSFPWNNRGFNKNRKSYKQFFRNKVFFKNENRLFHLLKIYFYKIFESLSKLTNRKRFSNLSSSTKEKWFAVRVNLPFFKMKINNPLRHGYFPRVNLLLFGRFTNQNYHFFGYFPKEKWK